MVIKRTDRSFPAEVKTVYRVGRVVVSVRHSTFDGVDLKESTYASHVLPGSHLDGGDSSSVFVSLAVLADPGFVCSSWSGVGDSIIGGECSY